MKLRLLFNLIAELFFLPLRVLGLYTYEPNQGEILRIDRDGVKKGYYRGSKDRVFRESNTMPKRKMK